MYYVYIRNIFYYLHVIDLINIQLFLYLGVHIHEEVQVQRVIAESGQVRAVETDQGDIQCQIFVNTAGMVRIRISQGRLLN